MPAFTCGLTEGCYGDSTQSWPGYPSAPEIAKRWSALNGCQATTTTGASKDLIEGVPGVDTVIQRYDDCPVGQEVSLWTILYGAHSPSFTANWAPAIVDWLLSQSKP